MRPLFRLLFFLWPLLLPATMLLACDDGSGGDLPPVASPQLPTREPAALIREYRITSTEFAFEIDGPIEGGMVNLRLENTGAEPHQAAVFRINDGVTDAQLQAAIDAGDPLELLALLTPEGGPNTIAPGSDQSVVQELDAGRYVLLCFVLSPDGVPHLAKGMSHRFDVNEGQTAGGPPAPPEADTTISLADFSFPGADTLGSGRSVVEVNNDGPQVHELTIMRLEDGVTLDQVTAGIGEGTPPPPAGISPITDAGGVAGLESGDSAWVDLDLAPGTYGLICLVPDAATGRFHFELGMAQEIVVR